VEPDAGDSDYRSVGRAVALIPSSWAVAKMGQESEGGMGWDGASDRQSKSNGRQEGRTEESCEGMRALLRLDPM
jgi:hypothetical protein